MRKFIFALAVGALLLPDHGFTLGLGEIEVDSALNQELLAEIELLSAAPEDVEALIVKLASREEFARAGLDRPYLLNSLRFSAEGGDGKPYIKVTSDKPIREPFLNFLVEIDWPKGHMMREYTILLDPPVFMGQQAPAMEDTSRPAASDAMRPAPAPSPAPPPQPQSRESFRPVTSGAAPPPTPQPTQTQATMAPVTAPSFYTPPDGYRIQQGDTLWSLADSMRPDQSVSIEQMMLAILRNNPEAFINENVNGLKRGYILRFPDRDQLNVMNHAEAVAVVREQNALWREYQQAVAGVAPASPMERDAAGPGAAMDDGSEARLEIVAAGSGVSAAGTKDPTDMTTSELRSELAITRESLESERLEKEELQTQVESLEGQVDRMKSLLTLEDADLAGMQEVATPVEEAAMPMEEAAPVGEEIVIEEQIEIMEEVVVEEQAPTEEAVVTEEEITVTEEAMEVPAEEQVFVDEAQIEVVEEAVVTPTMPEEPFAVDPTATPTFTQPQGPLAAILNNPVLLAAAGGGLLLILLLIALIMKRRKAGGAEEAVTSNLEDIGDIMEESDVLSEVSDEAVEEAVAEAEPEAETAAEEELDTESTVVLPSAEDTVVTQPEPQAEAEEPRDDIIAEADVYLAYGIYQQAEELLQNAIKENPDNDGYRVKLAETYFAGKNADSFTALATEMNQRRNGEDTPAWQKIVAIGKQLTPGNELFAGAAAEMVGELAMDDLVPHEPEAMDIDLDVGEGTEEPVAPDLDLELDQTQVAEEPLLEETEDEAADTELEGVEFALDEAEAVEPEQAGEEFSLDIEASELDIETPAETGDAAEFDLDLSDEADSLLGAEEEQAEEAVSLDDVDEGSLDFGEADVSAAAEEPVLEEPAAEAAPAPALVDEEMDLSDLDDIDEVSTKLDLARAYLDMGDADGTRSILDEVISEGNDTQKQEAEDLLKQLGT